MYDPIAVILAAGQGTRMKSELPKVLIEVCGRPMIHYVLDAVEAAGVARSIVVVGYKADDVKAELASRNNVTFALQSERLGTGHAVMMAESQVRDHEGPVLILAGDSPLAQSSSIARLLEIYNQHRPACLLGTLHKDDPTGLGRITRDAAGDFTGIVEEKDATDEQRRITEVNMSTYLFNTPDLLTALPQLHDNNQQGEYYVTDCPAILKAAGRPIMAEAVLQQCESLSINTHDELAQVEAEMRQLGLAN